MKCHSCGAIGSPGKPKCDFCGANIEATAGSGGNAIGETINTMAAPQVSFVKDTINLVGEINSTPSSGFNLMAFLFPVAYLWGYGAFDNAKKVAATTLIPALVISILGYLSLRLANMLDIVATIWVFFVAYLVSTRTHALIVKGSQSYNLGAGILAQVAFVFIYYIILLL
jgi:hypothetical protein